MTPLMAAQAAWAAWSASLRSAYRSAKSASTWSIVAACVGHLEFDGAEHYLQVTEKRNKKSRKILLDAARAVLSYVEAAGIGADVEGPLFRPMDKSGLRLDRRHMDRKGWSE